MATTNGLNGVNTSSPNAFKTFSLGSFSIDEDRPMKVVVIGAGFSGIAAGIRFPQRVKNLDLTIYEKNAGVGGTWYSNRYPGLACDLPSHTYQFSFEDKTDWSAFYAPGPEIRGYLEHVVDKYKLMRYIKLQHELTSARYDERTGKWHLKIRRPSGTSTTQDVHFEEFEDVADFVLAGTGALSRWSWPDIPGLTAYKETLVHSAQWEDVEELEGKAVGIIGVGSSAIQLVPALQPRAGKVFNFVRGKTWLATPFASEKLSELMKRDPKAANYEFTDEDKERFTDPKYYKEFRHELEAELNSVHFATIKDSDMQKGARKAFHEAMIERLEVKPWIADHLIPTFPVACRRLTPGPGYLEALCKDNVDFVADEIRRITPTGIETVNGRHFPLDILICATGYDTAFQTPFSVIGRNGLTLNERYTPHPETYLTMCTDGFPNWFQTLGPNSAVGSGSLLAIIEAEVEYAVAVVRKMQRERIRSVEVKREAVKDFDEYLEAYFPTTVYSEKCRSWYKMGQEEGRVVGLWPGSCLHAIRAMANPRWEDFDYKYLENTKNRFQWLGDGSTYAEKHMKGDRAFYLTEVDIPAVPE
ncbi:FAD/NAD(P)-binding domain-containing protein [Rickenella mellea]|uniref:FAD/NAD(P)-binding domain-containing protein n=1 Tax=Rickenella mellea TaxID=50990 RepID=A0A4Y7PW20_9AGAM|nr:FAD/NAD(P)-binding domain-containing protein [Rickenella mellea]